MKVTPNSAILGVQIDLERTVAGNVRGLDVWLTVNGKLVGSNQNVKGTLKTDVWPASGRESIFTFGSSSNLWDAALTADMLNSASFGVALRAQVDAGASLSIDFLYLVATYVPPTDALRTPPTRSLLPGETTLAPTRTRFEFYSLLFVRVIFFLSTLLYNK